jgi:type II restriction enzyme
MLTVRGRVIEFVDRLAKIPNAFDELEKLIFQFSHEELREALLECGVIPELFDHDSSQEKLWAKYCDILLALTLNGLGLNATVIRARGNSADVLATADAYTVVGDAKAFRLSRTAKNQKDFKVKALDDWRRENTFACLVGPLTQFPNTRSQIYEQAVQMNVTLVSYTHLRFLLEHETASSLEGLWTLGRTLKRSGNAGEYWAAVDACVASLSGRDLGELEAMKHLEIEKLKEIGQEGITYWQRRIVEYQELTQKEAVARLIKAEKIEAKIRTIKKAISWTNI